MSGLGEGILGSEIQKDMAGMFSVLSMLSLVSSGKT